MFSKNILSLQQRQPSLLLTQIMQ